MLADLDESIAVTAYDPQWTSWYESDSAELRQTLGHRLRALEHFGSTAVAALTSKPIVDILVAPVHWPLSELDRDAVSALGYEHMGEAGVTGREYFRRRRAHATNLAVVEFDGALWSDNLAIRDYLRAHPGVARRYGLTKLRAWHEGARTLLAYSESKREHVLELLDSARRWRRCPTGSGI